MLELEIIPAVLRCTACGHEWEIEEPPFWCPSCAGGGVTSVRGEELEVESIEIEEREGAGMHRTHVKVLEDVLDANGTIARGEPRRLRPRAA